MSLAGYLGFVEERMRRGSMTSTALSRATTAARRLPPGERVAFLGLGAPAPVPGKSGALRSMPVSLAVANAYVAQWHRHLGPVVGHKFSVAVTDNVGIRGVAIVGRPVARRLDDGRTLEVVRVATDGTRNACSAVLGAVRRAVIEGNRSGRWQIGRLITYTLSEESGASLRAAGWTPDGAAGGGAWCRQGRPRNQWGPTERKLRWRVVLP